MKSTFTALRMGLVLMLVMVMTAGCGLFNNAERERTEDNAAVQSGAALGDVVMAEGIGANNAPVEVTNTFDSSQDYIYVVAEAERLEAGTSMFARWSRDGQPFEDSSEVRADRTYENTYVEFHLENLQQSFEPGDYSVQIFINGNPAKEARFTVR
jgi:hypothetical protein